MSSTTVSGPTTGTVAAEHDDFALARVPETARYPWVSVALQRFGQLSALAQFLLGATLGVGLTFGRAVLAITLGSVLLELATILVGIAGVQQGLSTSLLARWTGFGRKGSALVGVVIALSLIGWFGVQSAIFADGLRSLLGGPPAWVWSLVGGIVVTLIVALGFRSMTWAAYITVPAFIALAAYSVGKELHSHSLSFMVSSAPAGPAMSIASATTLVAGGFIVGAVMTPDMTRYNRSVADVVKQTLVGVTLGEYVIGLIGVLLAHALRTANVTALITTTSGAFGTLILIASVLKVNDWNLYSGGLGLVNAINVLTGKKVSRVHVTLVVGIVGSILAAAGILSHFTTFLDQLGVLIPPVSGIMIAEYFLVKQWRGDLDQARERGELPLRAPEWVPAGLAAWAAGWAVGEYLNWGVPALNALVVAVVVYVILGKLGLVRRLAW